MLRFVKKAAGGGGSDEPPALVNSTGWRRPAIAPCSRASAEVVLNEPGAEEQMDAVSLREELKESLSFSSVGERERERERLVPLAMPAEGWLVYRLPGRRW